MPDAPARIAITGAAGFLGTGTVSALAARPATELIVALDIRPGPVNGDRARVRHITRDISLPIDDLLLENRIDTVIHLAYMLRTNRNKAQAWHMNVRATETLLASCAKAGVGHVIYLSSTTVYGANKMYRRPYVETDASNPVLGFQYSEQKAEAERLLLQFAAGDDSRAVTILRGCVVMAAGADNFIAQALGRRVLPAPAGADPELQFLHVSDYASAVLAVLEAKARGIYNIAGRGTVRWREMAALSGAHLVPVPPSILTAAVEVAWRLRLQNQSPACGLNFIHYPWLASTEKIESDLGWQPTLTSLAALGEWAESRRDGI